jgi:peptide/nickel transport system permease protein
MSHIDTRSSVPLPTDVAGGPAPTPAEEADTSPVQTRFASGNEGYATLVWRRFKRSPMGMLGLILVSLMLIISIFADFFAPMDPKQANLPFAPPDVIAFEDPNRGHGRVRSCHVPAVEWPDQGQPDAHRLLRPRLCL